MDFRESSSLTLETSLKSGQGSSCTATESQQCGLLWFCACEYDKLSFYPAMPIENMGTFRASTCKLAFHQNYSIYYNLVKHFFKLASYDINQCG